MTVPVTFMENRLLSTLRPSRIYRSELMEDIRLDAELDRFRGFGTPRPRPLPSFDDLTFIPCSLTPIPLEASAITGIPLVGTSYVPGRGRAE